MMSTETNDIFEQILAGADRFPILAELRRTRAALRVGQGWHMFRYEDVIAALRDPETFSSDPRHAPDWWRSLYPQLADRISMVLTDGESHRRLRRPLQRYFFEKVSERFEPAVRRLTRQALDGVDLARGFEVGEVLGQVPIGLGEEMLDLSLDAQVSRHWGRYGAQGISISAEDAQGQLGQVDRPTLDTAERVRDEMDTLVRRLVEERSRTSGSGTDLVSELLRFERRGEVDRREVESICSTLLLAAGQAIHEGIYNVVYALATQREIQRRLRGDAAAIPRFIQEALRLYTPSQYVTRVTTRPVSLQGCEIPAGEIVNLWLSSANRDEQAFARPDVFDIDRPVGQHVAFGDGPHYCLGAAVTALELQIIVEELLSRSKDLEVATSAVPWLQSLMAFRPDKLFVRDAPEGRRPATAEVAE